MAIAFDAAANGGSETGTSPDTWTHTPVGTPGGILVLPYSNASGDNITGVTYGGVALSRLAGAPSNKTTGEDSFMDAWFLGDASAIAGRTGDVVSVAFSSGAYSGASYTVTATGDTEFNNLASFIDDAATDPIGETLTLGGIASFVVMGFVTGDHDATLINPLTGWTERYRRDRGSEGYGGDTYDTIGTADVTYGAKDGGTDDYNIIAVAIKEGGGGGATEEHFLTLLGAGT